MLGDGGVKAYPLIGYHETKPLLVSVQGDLHPVGLGMFHDVQEQFPSRLEEQGTNVEFGGFGLGGDGKVDGYASCAWRVSHSRPPISPRSYNTGGLSEAVSDRDSVIA